MTAQPEGNIYYSGYIQQNDANMQNNQNWHVGNFKQ